MSPVVSPAGTGTWRCATCGVEHAGLVSAFGAPAPAAWEWAKDVDRSAGELNADMCVLPGADGVDYFLRGQLQLPVLKTDGLVFTWGVWVSLSEANMRTAVERWEDPTRGSLPPMFGWLSTALAYEPTTLGLATHVHTRAPGLAPLVELNLEDGHPLAVEQREGISLHRMADINATMLAPQQPTSGQGVGEA